METTFDALPPDLIAHMDKQRSHVAQLVAKNFPSDRITRTGPDLGVLQRIIDAELIPANAT